MDLTQLANLGEFIGGIAVVGSLIYVGLQVKQSNQHSRQTVVMERSRANREMTQQFTEVYGRLRDSAFAELVQRAASGFDQLSRVDQARIDTWIGGLHVNAVSAFLAGREGLVDEEYANAWVGVYVRFLKCAGFREWWEHTRASHHPGFVDFVEASLAASDGPAPIHTTHPWFALDGA